MNKGCVPINEAMGITGEWVPRFRVTAALVVASDQRGRLFHCYQGSLLGWLSEEQAAHFLRHGLVEVVDSADAPKLPASETILECVAALNSLRIEFDAGAPTARAALREAGHRFSNEVVAGAVKQRKLLSRRPSDDDEFDEIVV